MAFTKITAAGIGSTETVTLDGVSVINNESIGGNLTVTGNATVGGVLTYEDVTNVDSVGLITARNGVVVGSGITLSKDGDIFATGITTISENLKVGTGVTISPDGDGFFTGVTTATQVNADDIFLGDAILHIGDTNTKIRFPEADKFTVETAGTQRIAVEPAGNMNIAKNLNVAGVVTATSFSGSGANLTNIDSGMFIKTSAGIHTVGDQSNVGIGTTNPASGLDLSLKTDGIALPEGTTSQRPSGSEKFIRFNSTTGSLELYNGNQWVEILSDYSQTGSTALG